jgi:hypothetical protein
MPRATDDERDLPAELTLGGIRAASPLRAPNTRWNASVRGSAT